MANSSLLNTYHKIPEDILAEIQNAVNQCQDGYNGKKKAEFLLREKQLSYENLRRYKNFFDNYHRSKYDLNGDNDTLNELNPEMDFKLRGGQKMKDFVDQKLKELTNKDEHSKKTKSELGGLLNQYRKESEHNNVKISSNHNFIKEATIIEEKKEKKKMMKVSLGVIFNNENNVLLLKRSENTDWCPNCWALVGGKIEKNELPEEGLVREVFEETKIKLNKFKLKRILRIDDVLEYLYLCKVNDDSVELNGEHSIYKWVDINEIKLMDNIVPHLINYIKYVIK